MLKKSITCMAMIGAVALALASSGGGDKKNTKATPGMNVVKTTPGFSLKVGRSYSNSLSLKNNRVNTLGTNQSVLAYRKGNTVYILPSSSSKVKPVCSKNNLNLLNVKVKLRK